MQPVKIEIFPNKEFGLNVTILGIGNRGEEEVRKYPFCIDSEKHSVFKSLTLSSIYDCSEKISKQIKSALNQTELLFIIVDVGNENELNCAKKIVDLLKRYSSKSIAILIDISDNSHIKQSNLFDVVISVDKQSEAYKPIEMILSDMYFGTVGLDASSVCYMLYITPKMKFLQTRTEDISEKGAIIETLKSCNKEMKQEQSVQNSMFAFTMSQYAGLEDIEEILTKACIYFNEGEILWQARLNPDEKDKGCMVSMLYGINDSVKNVEFDSKEPNEDFFDRWYGIHFKY